ncbi:MAG: hypothetical protein ACO1QR_04845, partial [Chthoniobacteraceae bacterium]
MSESVEQPLLQEQNGESPKPATKRRATTKAKTTSTAKAGSKTTAVAKPRTTRKSTKKAATLEDADQAALPLEEAAPVVRTTTAKAAAAKAEPAAEEAVKYEERMDETRMAVETETAAKPATGARKNGRLKVDAPAAAEAAGEEWSPSASAATTRAPRKKPTARGRKTSDAVEQTDAPAKATPVRAVEAESAAPAARKAEAAAAPAETGTQREDEAPAAPAATSEPAIIHTESGVPVAVAPPPGRKYPVYIPRHLAKQLGQGEQAPDEI